MSQLSDKILSYAVETYLPMHSAVSVNPELYGTFLPTATPNMTTSQALPVYENTVNPPGGAGGSWRFSVPASTGNVSRIRFNQNTYNNQKMWDGQYGFGIWVRINGLPVGNTSTSYILYSTGRSSSFPGFSISVRGTAHTSGPGLLHNLFGAGSTPIVANPVIGQWYYIVGRKNRLTNGATIWVNGVKVATGTNTTFVEPVTAAEIAYPIVFEAPSASSLTVGLSYNLCHAHLMDFSTFTDAAIADIYTAGSTAPITNNLTYWNGSAWTVPTNKYQWNGINWVPMVGKYWNGTAWTNLT
jgi:hypothetical protein